MAKKKHGDTERLSAQMLQIEVLKFLLAHPKGQFSARQIVQVLRVSNNKDSVLHALQQLALAGSAQEVAAGKFSVALNRLTLEEEPAPSPRAAIAAPAVVGALKREKAPKSSKTEKPVKHADSRKMIEGVVDMTRSGAGYVVSELLDSDVYVAPKYMSGALNGDTVRVLLFSRAPRYKGREKRKPEGEVLSVLKRANEFFIGTLRKSRKYALVMPDNPNMPVDIYVALEHCEDARDGDKVVVRITDWQEGKGRVPMGKVTQVLGALGGNDFEMKKILINAGFELSHSEEAMAEAARISETISPQEIQRRRDFRDVLTFTIDPEDAKDFDDALSVQILDNGNMEVGVHIADVTHYLKPDSELDREAYKRSTSVYLVDRVNPMLPEKLSNNLCSLVPEQERLTFSAVFEFDNKDQVVKRWFGKTIIFLRQALQL
ncbi:MAG: RNB domain-containing ribonuclease [Lewinellaceae bacterium]|nr:RNB domain-containing ribonuclease [Lewinellaceae bacterium]